LSKRKSSTNAIRDEEKDADYYLKGHYDNVLLVRDNVLKKDIEVTIRGGSLFCDYHDTETHNCQHIEFAYSLDEIIKLKKGGKLR
jgi:hypothetical protein